MTNNKLIPIIIFAIFVTGGILYIYNPSPTEYKNQKDPETVFCTQDAKLCPDGSFVGRSGPNCEFDPCPPVTEPVFEDGTIPEPKIPTENPSSPVACTMDAKLCPDGSFVGRIGPSCQFAPCPTTQTSP